MRRGFTQHHLRGLKSLKKKICFIAGGAGFTLIELLVVIAIIGVLAASAIALINPLAQIQKAQDTKRKNDLFQIQKALEAYYADHGKYPDVVSFKIKSALGDGSAAEWGSGQWEPYMSTLPKDPNSSKSYAYNSDGQTYYLYASLDKGATDSQACNGGSVCASITSNPNACGDICNFGVSTPNANAALASVLNTAQMPPAGSTPAPTSATIPTVTPTPTSTSVPLPGLIGWWEMDDKVSGDGQTLVDSSTYGNDGTTHSADATGINCGVIGKYGGGCLFDGADDYVNCGNEASFDLTGDMTIELWIKTNNTIQSDQILFHRGFWGNGGYSLRQSGSRIVFYTFHNGTFSAAASVPNSLIATVWEHVFLVKNGTIARIFINGADATDGVGTIANPASISANILIGGYGSSGFSLNGIIDDVRVYNRALSQIEINSL